MTTHINPFKILALSAILSIPLWGHAGDGDNVEKKRTVSKDYTVGKDDKLSIENSFGEVSVSTWDKSEIKVDVEISVQASTEEKAQEMMNQIKVSDNQNGGSITFKTDIGKMGNDGKHKGDKEKKFNVSYKIFMPSGNPLTVVNSFGATNIPDMKGPVDLTSKFGELNAGKLDDVKVIHVEFGQVHVVGAQNGDITLKFNGKSNFEQVGGAIKLRVEFCNNVQFGFTPSISDLSVFESYSNINMTIPDGLSPSFDIHTSFGKFYNSTGYTINNKDEKEESYGPKFDSDYTGVNGDGKIKIKIKSSFGKVHLFHSGDKNAIENKEGDDDKDDNDKDNQEKEKVHV